MTQAIIHSWEKNVKSQLVPKLQFLGRFSWQLSGALKSFAKRAYTSISVNKEEEIRAWWRVQQEEKRIFWNRRGYSDAQHGTSGYPHHGTCYCAWCQAYWAGFESFQHGKQQGGRSQNPSPSPLGFLSPPPRKEILSRVSQGKKNKPRKYHARDYVIQSYPGIFSSDLVSSGMFSKDSAESTDNPNELSYDSLELPQSLAESSMPQPCGNWEIPICDSPSTKRKTSSFAGRRTSRFTPSPNIKASKGKNVAKRSTSGRTLATRNSTKSRNRTLHKTR